MELEGVDVTKLVELITQLKDFATCLVCCKFYIAPKKAPCGHALCHTCWIGCRACSYCHATVERRLLKLDSPTQLLTDNARELVEAFEQLFEVTWDEFTMDVSLKQNKEDPTKNVKEWLTSSENHFSVPPFSETQHSTQDILPPVQLSSTEIQIHAQAQGSKIPKKVKHVSEPQDDWDKIEVVTEYVPQKDKNNIIGPMDFEPFSVEDSEFSNEHPRRSNRKKVTSDKNLDSAANKRSNTVLGSNNSILGTDKKLDKTKQTWTNVKKIKKEFSKLNKQSKTKLNVSIEMCKKNPNMVSKQNSTSPPTANVEVTCIDDDTPNITDKKTDKCLTQPNMEVNKYTSFDNEKETFSVNENEVNINSVCPKQTVSSKNVSDGRETDKIISKNNSQKSGAGRRDQNNIENKQMINELVTDKDNLNVLVTQIRKGGTINIPFIKKSTIQAPNISIEAPNISLNQPSIDEEPLCSDDDIHISIRIKDVVTNITINNKQKDVQLKVNTDQAVQTSFGSSGSPEPHVQPVNTRSISIQTYSENKSHDTIKTGTPLSSVAKQPPTVLDRTTSIRKNTASAATATAQFAITESVEKELSNIMEYEEGIEEMTKIEEFTDALKSSKSKNPVKNNMESDTRNKINDISNNKRAKTIKKDMPEDLNLDDIDIFNSGSVKEHNVQMLNNSSKAISEVLVATHKSSKSRTQKNTGNRKRESDDIVETSSKRRKVETPHESIIYEVSVQKENKTSDSPDYDQLMDQVFSNIDADIDEIQSQKLQCTAKKSTGKTVTKVTQVLNKTQQSTQNEQSGKTRKVSTKITAEKNSENMFSTIGNMLEKGNTHIPGPETQQNIANLLTPGMCSELAAPEEGTRLEAEPRGSTQEQENREIVVLCTPMEEDDSDKSVVEETPQKNVSIPKTRNDSGNNKAANNKKLQLVKPKVDEKKPGTPVAKGTESQDSCSIINLTDSVRESMKSKDRNATTVPIDQRQTLETPLSIHSFVDEIRHKSTPMAKKSLKFSCEDKEDITICPTDSTLIAKTTQEKQFMKEAFENQPNSPARRPLIAKNVVEEGNIKYCIAGSCLSSTELTNLKVLCFKRKWTYVEKYRPDLTHLVVSVDEKNQAKRSVKYMCALAAGKWILSYEWVKKCLETNSVVNKEQFEALDSTGDPGPRRSRLADTKIFDGFTFCCLPPFSVLDLDTLVSMLEAAGGRVVKDPQLVRANTTKPSLLLCGPENTQEDRYMYLAMELGVVPVNYEWVLNSLGSYTLYSLHELLLCPASLLPIQVQHWPPEMIADEDTE